MSKQLIDHEEGVIKKLLTWEKFRQYLLSIEVIVYLNHVALKYLRKNKDAMPRLIWWIVLLQEFNFGDSRQEWMRKFCS